MDNETLVAANASDRVTIPKEKNAPKPEPTPQYKPKLKNFADKADTVSKVVQWARGYLEDFRAQGAWDKNRKNDDAADEMWRAALTRTQVEADASANKEDTRSNVSSTSFNRVLRHITAGEMSVVLGNETDLPVEYEPDPNATDYREDEGRRIADHQNALLSHYFTVSKLARAIRRIFLFGNKYANQLIEAKWDYRKQKVRERVPTGFRESEEEGVRIPTGFSFKESEKIVADNPCLVRHDNKDWWADAMIENIQDQSCVVTRTQKQLGDLFGLQKTSEFTNVGKITTAQLYQGEGEAESKGDRQTNASESDDTAKPTTLFDVYHVWIRVPIEDDTGKWNPEAEVPHWYEATFIGDLAHGGAVVCVQLRPNPHGTGDIPLEVFHSHDDDKGLLHLGYAILAKCLYMMETTVWNQTFDNNTLRTQKPLIADRGSLSIRDKTFTAGGNRVWWKQPGAQDPHEMDIQDTTQQSIPLLEVIKEVFNDTLGANKPFLGEALGSRTSASEAINVLEQAVKPALEDAKYKGDQVLTFVAKWFMDMSRQFGDPRREVKVTYNGHLYEVKPTELWGPLNIRVTSIKKFQDSILRRREEDQFLNQFFPLAQPYMSKRGIVSALTQIAKNRNYDDVDAWWDMASDYDAKRVARSENDAILFGGVTDLPKQEENHEAHLTVHKPFLASYTFLPEEEQNPENIRRMKQHILMHEQMDESAKSRQAESLVQGAPARTPGEATGDNLGAEAGAIENIATPEEGRPPLAVA